MPGSIQDDIRKFQLEINASNKTGETLAQLTKLEKETAKLRSENTELQKVMAHLDSQGRKNSDTYKKFEAQLKANRKTIDQNATSMKGLQKNLDLNFMSMNQLKKRAGQLRSTLNSMSKAANPKEYDKLEKELGQVGTQMDKLRGKTNKTKGVFTNLAGSAKSLLPAFGWTAIIAGAVELGKKIFDLALKTGEYRKQVQKLTGESGKDLVKLTANLEATGKTFEQDLEKLAVANNNFAKSMDISQESANKLINEGFIAGADGAGEFLDKLKEYGPQFKAAGISAEDAIVLMTQEVKSGIYSDKGIDAIKEAGLALREMPQTARDAVDAIGLSSKEMMEKLHSGEISVGDAIKQVSKQMATLPPQSVEVGQALADIFKGAGEDAGLDYILMLGDAEASMDDLIEKTGESAVASQRMLEINQEFAQSWGELLGEGTGAISAWTTTAKIFAKEGLVSIINGFKDLRGFFAEFHNNSAVLRGAIQLIGLNFKLAFQLAKAPLLEFWELLKGMGKTAKAVFTLEFNTIDDIWAETWSNMKQIAADGAKDSADAVVNAWNKTIGKNLEFPVEEIESPELRTAKQILGAPGGSGAPSGTTKTDKDSSEKTKSGTKANQFKKRKENQIIEEIRADIAANEAKLRAEETFQRQKKQLLEKYQTLTIDELHAEELNSLQLLHEQKLISEEEFQFAKQEMEIHFNELQAAEDDRVFQEKLAKYGQYVGAFSMIAQGGSQVVQDLQQAEFAQLEFERDQGLIDEEQFEKQGLAVKKKYADKNFIAALANIAANTAQGIMQSYANYEPITASILATIPLAAGIVQGINANKERQRVKSLADGGFAGFTGPGSKFEKKQLTQLHGEEFVIPREGVLNPNLRPFIELMEQQRVAGTISSMNLPNISAAQTGGFQNQINQTETTASIDTSGMMEVTKEFNSAVDKLKEGIPAFFNEEATRDITEQQEFDQELLNETSFA